MPTKHTVKQYDAPAFYHLYNRASGERLLFRDADDRIHFLSLLQKHLVETEASDAEDITRTYAVEVVAYCLMGTHFHLLLYQEEDTGAITGFMRSVSTAYSMYYNKKYKCKGHVFQSSYRASHVDNEAYLAHITRYIHLNPRNYETWKWGSYQDYIGNGNTEWVHPERVLNSCEIGERYAEFVRQYATTDRRVQKSAIEHLLAI